MLAQPVPARNWRCNAEPSPGIRVFTRHLQPIPAKPAQAVMAAWMLGRCEQAASVNLRLTRCTLMCDIREIARDARFERGARADSTHAGED